MEQSVQTNPSPRLQTIFPLFPNPDVYHPTSLDLRGFLRCRSPPPNGIQDVLFYITARFNGHFRPLAIVSQAPPAANKWQPVNKAFVVTAAQKIHNYLSDPFRHALLASEVQSAGVLHSQGRTLPLAPAEPPGVASAEDRAIWLDNAPYRHAARALLHCLTDGEGRDEEYWTPLELRTRFGLLDCRYRAVVFDITDLARVTCGVIENDVNSVLRTSYDPPRRVEECRRTVWTVPRWVATQNEFERLVGRKDGSAEALMATFPDVPMIERNVLQMLWTTDDG